MKTKLKALVIEKADDKEWSTVNVTKLTTDGVWHAEVNSITSIKDVIEQAIKQDVPIITTEYVFKRGVKS